MKTPDPPDPAVLPPPVFPPPPDPVFAEPLAGVVLLSPAPPTP